MTARKLRIFLSSPGDVGQERLIAVRVLDRLHGEFQAAVELEPILWEHEPLRSAAHFQEQILPPSQTDIVVCILWSRLGTRLPEQFAREDGSRYASGTEWEFEDALRAFRERGAPDLMVYRKTAEPHASMSDEAALLQRLDQKKALDAFVDRWFGNARDSFRLAFHTFDSPDKFETLLETHLRKLIQERLPEHVAGGSEGPAAVQWHRGSPFRGLEAFDFEHAPVFFGRTRAIAGIREALVRQADRGCAFLLVFGMSGCGKSSLVRAGVLPTITQPGVIEGIGLWRWGILRPSDAPADLCLAFAHALLAGTALPELTHAGLDAHELAALFRQAPERAVAALRCALGRAAQAVAAAEGLGSPPQARLALVVDQLEELFTLPSVEAREREGFVAAITALARSGFVWVLGTMRSDFYPRCAEIPGLAALKEGAGQFDVLPASFTEIGHMIRCPARAAGLSFEVNPATGERLDDRLHEAAARDPEALPLLEFTLEELFQQRTSAGVLTLDAYDRMGGLEGALARRAEEVFLAQPPAVQAALPAVLRALVAVEADRAGLVAARRAPLVTVAASPERQSLVDAFIEARLLVTDRTEDGQAVVRVAHEALLRHWPRLQSWLEEDLAFLKTRERVAVAALRWQEEARDSSFLLAPGKPLADAQDLLAKRREELEAGLVEYLEVSVRAATGARRRRLHLVAGVTGGFFAVVLGFGLFSHGEWRKAEQQKRLALDAVSRLTYDIPKRLIDLPGSRPALRTIFAENLDLLNRIADSRAQHEKRTNFRYMGDIWLLLGDPDKAANAYQTSLQLAQALARNDAGPAEQWELAVSQTRVGDARLETGDARGALDLYTRSLAILERLLNAECGVRNAEYRTSRPHSALRTPHSAFPADRLRRDLSAGYEKIGDTRLAMNDVPGALNAYEKDMAIASELARQTSDPQAQIDLSVSGTKIGDARLLAGDAPGALDRYRKSIALLRDLLRSRRDPVAERDLSAGYLKLGDVYLALHQTGGARSAYLQGMALARRLARDRTNARAQRDLAVSYTKLGDLRLALHDVKGALDAYQTSLALNLELAADKSNTAALQDLKFVYDHLRDLHARLGEERAALRDNEKSLMVDLELLQDRKTAPAQRERAALYQDLGATRLERGDLPAALAAYQQALEIARDLAGGGSDPVARRALAAAYDKVAYLDLLCRRPQEAIAVATEGVALDPRQARLETTLAHGYLFANQFAKARELYLQNRSRRVDDRQTFAAAIRSDFAEFRSRGLTHPDMLKIERLLAEK